MKKKILSAALLSIATFAGMQTIDAQDAKMADSMLWSIVNPEMPADTSYLFGTIHQISKSDFVMTPQTINALAKSDVLVTEIDLSNPNMMGEMMGRMQLEDGMTLRKLLTEADYSAVNTFMLKTSGQSLALFNTMKPIVVAMSLMDYYIDGASASYDLELTQMALRDSIKILGLETVAQQMDVLDKMPYDEQAEYLVELVNDSVKTREMFKDMVMAYKAGNLNDLSALLDENMQSESEKQFMIIDRNTAWVPVIADIIQESSAFIAVGAGHLAGDEGLIKLLRNQGYEVQPVHDSGTD